MASMITFDTNKGRFNHRAAAVLLCKNHVLLHQAEAEDFWSLPGGRVELLEPSAKTVERELFEELGLRVKVNRLLWVVENFFHYAKANNHELGFYYLVETSADSFIFALDKTFEGVEDGRVHLRFKWFALETLEAHRIYPSFLKIELQNLPSHPRHLVHYDT